MPRLDFLAMVLLTGAMVPACSPGYVRHSRLIGPATYAIDCDEQVAECYEFALARCPYGYTTEGENTEVTGASVGFGKLRINKENSVVVRCKPPVFCDETEACEYGTRCVESQTYPGRRVCSVR